jgi:hypothetical protein
MGVTSVYQASDSLDRYFIPYIIVFTLSAASANWSISNKARALEREARAVLDGLDYTDIGSGTVSLYGVSLAYVTDAVHDSSITPVSATATFTKNGTEDFFTY